MNARILSALVALLSVAHADTIPLFTTRDGKTYQNAQITRTDATNATVEHDAGTTAIPLEQLPPEIQKRLGYKTEAERTAAKSAAESVDPTRRTEEDFRKAEAWKAAPASQTNASKFFNMPKAEVVKLLGEPTEILLRYSSAGNSEQLNYGDANKLDKTFFVISESDGRVSSGYVKGVPVISPEVQQRKSAK